MTHAAKAEPTTTGTLILLRHGRTALNAQGKFQGQTATPLDDLGRAQVTATAQRLRDEGIRDPLILSSDLTRAVQSAQIVQAKVGGILQTNPALREIAFGEWDEQVVSDIENQFPQDYRRFYSGDPSFTFPSGESGNTVSERAYTFLQPRLPLAGQTVIVVAHQLTIFALLTKLLQQDYQTVWPTHRFNHANAAFSRLSFLGSAVSEFELGIRDHLHV